MKIVSEPTAFYKYAFQFGFDWKIVAFCKQLKSLYGFKEINFDMQSKTWRFNNLSLAIWIKKEFPEVEIDDNLQVDLGIAQFAIDQNEEREHKAEELKTAEVSDLEISSLKGELRPYQKIGVEFLENSRGKAMLIDEQGLGKSLQSLAFVVYSNKKKILVVCPASVKHSWKNEVKKWTKLRCCVVDSKTMSGAFLTSKYDLWVINYDILQKFEDVIKKAGFDCIIGDEFTYIKNSKALRSKSFKRIATGVPSVILLSGTPILSRPIELYNGLNLIDPLVWNNFINFSVRYCQGHTNYWGAWDARGASNIEELQQRISKYFLRRTKEQVAPELPKKIIVNRPIALDGTTQKKYDMAVNDFGKFLREIKNKKGEEILRALRGEKLAKLGELRQLTTMGKLPAAKEIIDEIIDNGEKVLVFSCYNKPLEELYEKYKDCSVMITGKTEVGKRGENIDAFQNNPNIKIFFGGTKSAGIGITLTAAANVLFLDYSWCPADHAQSMDRCHRIGQTADRVNVYFLYALDTIDVYMTKLLEKKQYLFDKLIEGKDGRKPSGSVLKNVLRVLERKTKDKSYDELAENEDLESLDFEQEDD